MVSMPSVVSAQEWQSERDALLAAEKKATRLLDGLAAQRRRLPMVRFDNEKYLFDTIEGPKRLLDFFEGRQQLAIYQFMDNGPDAFCPGCTHFTSNVTLVWRRWPTKGWLGERGVQHALCADGVLLGQPVGWRGAVCVLAPDFVRR